MYVTSHYIENDSEVIGESDRYDWQGELIESQTKRVRKKRQLQAASQASHTVRKDEPQAGTIVLVANVTMLDEYLVGTARSPFRNTRSNYIIILRYIFKDWKEHVERVLRKLWRIYGIVNVLLLAPCLDSGEELLASYFPYAINASIVDPIADDFGATKWKGISEMDYSMKWLRKLIRMNGFPFRVSIFKRYPTAIKPPDLTDIMMRSYYNRAMKFSGGFGGFDGMVLGNIAEKMNFRTKVVSPTLSDFGWVDLNGSVFGKLTVAFYISPLTFLFI